MSNKTNYPNLTEFFKRNHAERNWATEQTVSGVGSELKYTRDLHTNLVAFIKAKGITSVLDIPCGDINWIKHVLAELPEIEYTGADIAPNLIDENRDKYPDLTFKTLNVTSSALPPVDLVIVRDCLVHLPTELVLKALINLAKTKAKFIALTTFPEHPSNMELSELGGWRTINLCAAPYLLPTPLEYIAENCAEYNGEFVDKSLGVWSPAQIKEAISARTSSL